MNCHEVQPVITDLARNSVLEIEAREGALAHLKECRECSARLVEEKRLTEGLRAWNAAMIDEQPRPALEEKLRAAFRQNVRPAQRRHWPKFAAAGAIAAAVLLFKLLAPVPQVKPIAKMPPQSPAPVIVAQVPAAGGAVPSPGMVVRRRQANRLRHPAPDRSPIPASAEVGTEFLPVAQGDGWTPLDGGRLVRVRLPRSAMGAFGLPVDEGRGPERVKADVMLSDDGLLRAIRFVR